jgi:hypothetical protein
MKFLTALTNGVCPTAWWRLAPELSLRFRAESINFLNTPQLAEPSFNLVSPSFGAITNTLNDGRVFRFRLQLQF